MQIMLKVTMYNQKCLNKIIIIIIIIIIIMIIMFLKWLYLKNSKTSFDEQIDSDSDKTDLFRGKLLSLLLL